MVAQGTYRLGPENASLVVKTYREGAAAKVGHDLVIDVGGWEATVELAGDPTASSLRLDADPRSLIVREGVGGVKPLTDKDRLDIGKTIDTKVLGGVPITFRSQTIRIDRSVGRLSVDGELTLGGVTRSVRTELKMDDDGRVTGTIPLVQSHWGIKPYRGLMGALKVRDEVEIVIDVALAPS